VTGKVTAIAALTALLLAPLSVAAQEPPILKRSIGEIEALVVLQRKAFRFVEEPCRFHPRMTGKSSITPMKSVYYIVHVLLGVFVNVLRLPRLR